MGVAVAGAAISRRQVFMAARVSSRFMNFALSM
jgi:hypothetical protein